MSPFRRSFVAGLVSVALVGLWFRPSIACGQLTAREVVKAIEKGKRALISQQQGDGSWKVDGLQHDVGDTCLALLALINTGMTTKDAPVDKGLNWLRRRDPTDVYQISLMIQTFAAVKDEKRDVAKVRQLASLLESYQLQGGFNNGSWSYTKGGVGDRSNAQFAVLGLREAQEMGVSVGLDVWRRARNHWLTTQNGDGSWSYSAGRLPTGGTGSMTAAGITTLVITQAMLRQEEKELNADGTPNCCGDPLVDKPLEDACRWMGDHFSVVDNPGGDQRWLMYYLYGLERAGRFSGRRFFVSRRGAKHDWYRKGAEYLVAQQHPFTGTWNMRDGESFVRTTSFALIFLSKGLAPVLINKLQYGAPDRKNQEAGAPIEWNRHPDDVRNLTQLISNRPKWPKLLTWQTVDVNQAEIADLMQAPILFISGTQSPNFSARDRELFKEYILQGGTIVADNNCRSAAFDEAFRDLIRQMYPPSETQLKKLPGDHPVYRSEFEMVDRETGVPAVELWGVDVGCRTSIFYSPHDLSCLWDKWTNFQVPSRPQSLVSMITKATNIGVNIVAYATGREILNKMAQQEQTLIVSEREQIQRDLLEIRKIRYTGDWNAAPQALKNLLVALNRTTGAPVSGQPRDLQILDPNLFRTPIAYMHGRHDFKLNRAEQDKLREYLAQGGVLFSDSCCGVPAYDRSFRELMKVLFPENELKRIPVDHEIFKIGYELKLVKRREPDVDSKSAVQVNVKTVEPFLEGIEVNGRYVVVYSKYDISCALERQSSVACTGYIHEDAVRLGVNIVLYFLNQ